jgi:non-ribosomal peptide synthetase component F
MILTDHIHQHAKIHPGKTAVVFENRRITWEELHLRSNRVANRLTRLQIVKGDCVAIVSWNCLEYPEIMFGALKAGTTILTVSTDLAPDDVARTLHVANARAVFAGHSSLALVAGFRKLCTKIVVEGREEGWLTYEGFLKAGLDSDPAHILTAEESFSRESTHGERLRFAETCGRELNINPDSISAVGSPLHAEATQRLFLSTVLAGGTLVLTRSFDPIDFAELVRREGCTHAIVATGSESPNLEDSIKNDITFVEFV